MLIGRRQPGVHRDVVVDHHAEHVEHGGARDRLGRVEVVRLLRRGAGEIDGRLALLLVDRDLHPDRGAEIHRIFERGIVQAVDHAAHALGRVVLHVLHVGLHHRQREVRHHLAQLVHALLVGGDLRLHVVDVLQRIARRILRAVERVVELLLAETALIDDLEVVEQHAFFLDRRCVRRHRAGRDAADVGVVTARRDPEQDVLLPVVEHRRADRDVGQVGAAIVGRVDHVDVARFDPALVVANDRLDRAVHRAEMHRHVRRVRHQRAVVGEHRAGEVEPLLDVHRVGGVLQRDAHLLGDRHEQVVEHLEHDRIGLGADGARRASASRPAPAPDDFSP